MNSRFAFAAAFAIGLALAPAAQSAVLLSENFDGVVIPNLPVGWTTTFSGTDATPWVTSTTSPFSVPAAAFVDDPSTITDVQLLSPIINVTEGSNLFLSFMNAYDMENGFDGGVLEISVDGGVSFIDIAFVGVFDAGGYNATISSVGDSPIGGRQAWTGFSGGYISTIVDFVDLPDGSTLQLRWRRATDSSASDVGWRIDNIILSQVVPEVVPEPPTLALLGIGLAGLVLMVTRKCRILDGERGRRAPAVCDQG